MTFCVGMKIEDGLVGIADTRVTTRTEHITARKVTVYNHQSNSMFVMTSGLRSVRDKAITYFDELLEESELPFDKLYKMVNAFARQVRRVSDEDKNALAESGLSFNLHSIIGGQFENDQEHKLYLLYPQGNWVEVGEGTPYFLIGESSFGKPILDRVLNYTSSIKTALRAGYLAFDATRTSATDVGFPLDVVLYKKGSYVMAEHRFEREDVISVSQWWHERLRDAVDKLPSEWMKGALSKLP